MSIDGFFNDILASAEKLAEDFAKGDPDEVHTLLQNQLAVRADLARNIHTAPNQLQGVVAQQAYDAASVLERQLSVLSQGRQDYHDAAKDEREWAGKNAGDLRSHGTYFKGLLPKDETGTPTNDEPYLDANGDIVFDE